MNTFMSYARRDAVVVGQLCDELRTFGCGPWVDRELSGGQDWWAQVLDNIRQGDLFVLAASAASLESEACTSEWRYAVELRRPILPVLVDGDASILPDELRRYQCVVFTAPTLETVRDLGKALLNAEAAPPLPDPLPAEPARPSSYGEGYRRRIMSASLQHDEQLQLKAVLMDHRRHPSRSEEATELLQLLFDRHDVSWSVKAEIGTALGLAPFTAPVESVATSEEPAPATDPSLPTPPTDTTHEAGDADRSDHVSADDETDDAVEADDRERVAERGDSEAWRQWEQHLTKILSRHHTNDFYVGDIPQDMLDNAITTAGIKQGTNERIIALIDLTWFGSAKNCIVFTSTRMRCQHSWMNPRRSTTRFKSLPKRTFEVRGSELVDAKTEKVVASTSFSTVSAEMVLEVLDTVREAVPKMPTS